MTVSTNMLTEKGFIKPEARTAILNHIAEDSTILGNAEAVEGKKNVYTLSVEDAEGHIAYVNIDLTVSTVYPADRKVPEKKAAAKKPAEREVFTIA